MGRVGGQAFAGDNLQVKALICSRLRGRGVNWFYSGTDCVRLSSTDLLRKLRKMYEQQPNSLTLRRQLEVRICETGETFAEYLHNQIILANRVPLSLC